MDSFLFNEHYNLRTAVIEGRKTMTRRLVGKRMAEGDIKAYFKGYTELANKCAPYKIDDVVAVAEPYKNIFEPDVLLQGSKVINGKRKKGWYPAIELGGWNNPMFICPEYMQHFVRITDVKVELLQDISEEDCLKESVGSFLDIISLEGTEKYEKKADAIHWIEGGDDTHGWADQGINYCEKCAEKEAKKMNKGLAEELYRAVYSYGGGNEEDSSVFCEECGKPLLYLCLFTCLDEDLENMCLDSMCDLYLLKQILDSDHRDYAIEKLARLAFAALIDKVSGKGTWNSNPYVFVYTFKFLK